jgi:hypothetical protein
MEENNLMETISTNKSVNITVYFNGELDDGEVQDFVDRILHKYHDPDNVVSDYEYWHDES